MAFNDPDMEADHLDEPIWPTTGPDFREGTETNVSPDLTHLRMLQAALPSACMLTTGRHPTRLQHYGDSPRMHTGW